MSTASLSFPAASLTFSGVNDLNPLGLIAMNRPGRNPQLTYAERSVFATGDLPTHASAGLWSVNAVVHLKGTSQAVLETQYAALVAAVETFTYDVVQEFNGVTYTWAAHVGTVRSVDDEVTVTDLDHFEALYQLTIPVQPDPVVA